jgi:hypothetical protein
MGWPETAKRIAEMVVRPVVVADHPGDKKTEMGVGLFVGEECKFMMPVRFVIGTDDYEKLTEDIRQIFELAIVRAANWEKLVGANK